MARGQQLDKVMDVAERGQQQGEGMSVAKQLGARQMGGKQDAQLDQQERRATGGQLLQGPPRYPPWTELSSQATQC